jgi:uncharacterized protein YgiM (DUF1202 family)
MTRRVKVILTHRSNYPEPFSLEEGDRVAVGRTDNEYPGWIRIRLAKGNEGWVPLKTTEPATV